MTDEPPPPVPPETTLGTGEADPIATGPRDRRGTTEPARIALAGALLELRPSGALFWADRGLLAVGDLHLGRAERMARLGAGLLPPYECRDTLDRLEAEIRALEPRLVICLGDNFDDLDAAEGLGETVSERIAALAAGRRWVWVAGNHDPGPVSLPGTYLEEVGLGPIAFRHMAEPRALGPGAERGEVSAHFHPKAQLVHKGARVSRACFLADGSRVILPAFGTYTGGLDVRDPVFDGLIGPDARAYLLGLRVTAIPRAALG